MESFARNTTHVYCPWNYDQSLSENPFWIQSDEFNCSLYYQCYCPGIKADPDIAGKGVVAAFIATAALTLFSTIMCLALHRKADDQFPHINPVDRYMRRRFPKWLQDWLGPRDSRLWALCFYDVTIALSDQQLVTGLALLIAGLIKLFHDRSITVYHFSIVSDLAWFSANTHLLSLLVVVRFDGSVKPALTMTREQRREFTRWPRFSTLIRMTLMIVLAALLLCCCAITAYKDWNDEWCCPAICTVGLSWGGEPLRWFLVSLVLNIYAYSIAIPSVLKRFRVEWLANIKPFLFEQPSSDANPIEDTSRTSNLFVRALSAVTLAFRSFVIYPIWCFLASEFVSILEMIAWFALGINWTTTDRARAHDPTIMLPKEADDEESWGFGQLVPVILLLLPVVQFIESFSGRRREIPGFPEHDHAHLAAQELEEEFEMLQRRMADGDDAPAQSEGSNAADEPAADREPVAQLADPQPAILDRTHRAISTSWDNTTPSRRRTTRTMV